VKKGARAWDEACKKWTKEVESALASSGVPWKATSCWCEERTSAWCAELTHLATGKTRCISIAGDSASTVTTRRAEIIRQVQEQSGG
jgi:hypothetical protein